MGFKNRSDSSHAVLYTKYLLVLEDNKETVQKYLEEQRSETGKFQDTSLLLIKKCLEKLFVRPDKMIYKDYKKLVKKMRKFFVDDDGRLYRRDSNGAHKLVVEKERQMFMMEAAHDNLGHRGFHTTKMLIGE